MVPKARQRRYRSSYGDLVPVQRGTEHGSEGLLVFWKSQMEPKLVCSCFRQAEVEYHLLLNWEQANFWLMQKSEQTENIIIQHTLQKC